MAKKRIPKVRSQRPLRQENHIDGNFKNVAVWLVLDILMRVMGMFHKQDFKRRHRRRAWRRHAMDHEVLFSFFMLKPFNLVETHRNLQAIQESRQPKVNALLFSSMMEFATHTQQLGGLGQVTCVTSPNSRSPLSFHTTHLIRLSLVCLKLINTTRGA